MKKVKLCNLVRNDILTSDELFHLKAGDSGGGGSTYCNIFGCGCCCCGCGEKADVKATKCRCTDRSASAE